jgi:hypothetical protein
MDPSSLSSNNTLRQGQVASVPGFIQLQRTVLANNPIAYAGSAGAASTHRYDHIRHGQPPNTVPPLSKAAPDLPADVLTAIQNPLNNQKLRRAIRITTAEDSERMAAIEEQCTIVHDRENPFTRKHRRAILITWSIIVHSKYPDLPLQDHWTTPIVLSLAKFYLRWRVDRTPGMKGAKYVKAVTLKNWMTHLVHCIVKFGRDPLTGERSGLIMLVQHNLMEQMEQEVAASTCPCY